MSKGMPIGFEMEYRYSDRVMWLCPACKKRGVYSYNNEKYCKRCGYDRESKNENNN